MAKGSKEDDKGTNGKGKGPRKPRKVTKSPFGIQVQRQDAAAPDPDDLGSGDTSDKLKLSNGWADVVVDETLESTSACEKWVKKNAELFTDQVIRIIQIKCERTLTVVVKKSVSFA